MEPTGHATVEGALRRSIQLDALAYLIIAALMILVSGLAAMLLGSIRPPSGWILDDTWVQLTGLALIAGLVIYLLDQHARMRKEIALKHQQLADSQAATERAFKGLYAAHHAAEVMVAITDDDSLEKVAASIRTDMGADAVAIVAEDTVVSTGRNVEVDRVLSSVTKIASDSVRQGASMVVRDEEDGSETIALPLRLMGKLRAVLCVWRAEPPFTADEREGLHLVARVIELGWESSILYRDVNARFEGLRDALTELVELRVPEYRQRTETVMRLATSVGEQLGMTPSEIDDLRTAVELRDLGVLAADADQTADADLVKRQHPSFGARLAGIAGLPSRVRHAILCHHEAPDGSGYPGNLTADLIPLEAHILHACDDFVAMTPDESDTAARHAALRAIRDGAHKHYDAAVAAALLRIVVDGRIALMRNPAHEAA